MDTCFYHWISYQKCSRESWKSWDFSGKLIWMPCVEVNTRPIWNLFIDFWLLFGCPMANYKPLLRVQPHSPDVNHCAFTYFTQMSPEHLVGFEPGTFIFRLQHLNPPYLFECVICCNTTSLMIICPFRSFRSLFNMGIAMPLFDCSSYFFYVSGI